MAGEEKEMSARALRADLKLLSDEELEQRFSQQQEIVEECTHFSLKTFREKPKGENNPEWSAKVGQATARRKKASDELQLVRNERTNRERSRKEQSERSKRRRNEEAPEAHGPAELANPERAVQSASPGSALLRAAAPPPPAPALRGPAVSAVSALAAPNVANFGLPRASPTAASSIAVMAAVSTEAAAPAEPADGPHPKAATAPAPDAPGGNGLTKAGAEPFVPTTREEAAEYVSKYNRRRRESAQRLREKYLSSYFESDLNIGDLVVKESRQDPVLAFLTVSSEDEEDQAPDDTNWRAVEQKKKHTGSRSR